jgi:hypothetical protein
MRQIIVIYKSLLIVIPSHYCIQTPFRSLLITHKLLLGRFPVIDLYYRYNLYFIIIILCIISDFGKYCEILCNTVLCQGSTSWCHSDLWHHDMMTSFRRITVWPIQFYDQIRFSRLLFGGTRSPWGNHEIFGTKFLPSGNDLTFTIKVVTAQDDRKLIAVQLLYSTLSHWHFHNSFGAAVELTRQPGTMAAVPRMS